MKPQLIFFTCVSFLLSINMLNAQTLKTNTTNNIVSDVNTSGSNRTSSTGTIGCYCLPVSIASQPASPPPVCVGGDTVHFTVITHGTGPFTYQWRENAVIINEGGIYSGTATATLTIINPPASLNGKIYRCVVTNCSGTHTAITNNNATITVNASPTDINKDGITNLLDFFLLNQQLNTACTNCPEDINQDGLVNINDFLQLLSQYNKTCM